MSHHHLTTVNQNLMTNQVVHLGRNQQVQGLIREKEYQVNVHHQCLQEDKESIKVSSMNALHLLLSYRREDRESKVQ